MKQIAKIFLHYILPALLIIFLCYWFIPVMIPKQNIELVNMDYELGIIKNDLQTYNKLSEETINDIIIALKETSIKYKLPVGLLHCINRVESEYQFNVVHPSVSVNVHSRNLTTNAVGTGGIMWCYWGDSLKNNKIAEMETDLFFPVKSIHATGYILRYLIDDEIRIAKQNGNRITSSNILSLIMKRYYGAYSESYLSRMPQITSDLWMKRIANELVSKHDTTANHVILNKETIRKEK